MTNNQIDKIKQILEALMPIAEVIDAIGLNLNSDMSCPPRNWINKFSPHAEILFGIGKEQIVLISSPKWFKEKIEKTFSYETIIDDEEEQILSSIKEIDRILVKQAVHAYEMGDYTIATTGLSVFLEGFIAERVGKSKAWNTRIREHAEELINDYRNGHEILGQSLDDLCLYVTLKCALETYSADSDFTKEEPDCINRHWLAHGRSRRECGREDCLKIMSIVGGVNKL